MPLVSKAIGTVLLVKGFAYTLCGLVGELEGAEWLTLATQHHWNVVLTDKAGDGTVRVV